MPDKVKRAFNDLRFISIFHNGFERGQYSISTNKWIIITLVNIFLLIVGMCSEPRAAIILFAPIFAPSMQQLGFDPVHFGIIMMLNMCIGLCIPPLGLCLFTACSITRNISLERMSIETVPFIACYLLVLFHITYIPAIAIWLPRVVERHFFNKEKGALNDNDRRLMPKYRGKLTTTLKPSTQFLIKYLTIILGPVLFLISQNGNVFRNTKL